MRSDSTENKPDPIALPSTVDAVPKAEAAIPVPEINGRQGPDPTRYGDWENKGRCIDF